MKRSDSRQLAENYWESLQEYLAGGSEAALARGYEIARQALGEGAGILDLADSHHRALRRLGATRGLSEALLKQAGRFFAECLSPFEMSHRGAQEGTRALRHHNEALEAELKRIAHALHDEAGQMLASVHIALAGLADGLPAQTRERIRDIDALLKQIENELRSLSHELRPTVLDNLGLVPALEFLADKVTQRTGLAVSVSAPPSCERLPAPVETALYRIVQEALNNAAKHAQATVVQIVVTLGDRGVECRVRDNGRGFDARGARASGLGLLGIRERLNALGGSLRVASRPRHGTTLVAGIPIGDSHAQSRAAGR